MVAQPSALDRLFQPDDGSLSEPLARYILGLNFPAADQRRYEELSYKSQEPGLTPAETEELEDLLAANDVLTLLQSKARASLNRHTSR